MVYYPSSTFDTCRGVTGTLGKILYDGLTPDGEMRWYFGDSSIMNLNSSGLVIGSTTTKSGTSNSNTLGSCAFQVSGDASTLGTLFFDGTGTGIPTVGTRSTGSKIVLASKIGVSTTDHAIGTTSSSVWTSTSGTVDTYVNNVLSSSIGATSSLFKLGLRVSGITGNTTGPFIKLDFPDASGDYRFTTDTGHALTLSSVGQDILTVFESDTTLHIDYQLVLQKDTLDAAANSSIDFGNVQSGKFTVSSTVIPQAETSGPYLLSLYCTRIKLDSVILVSQNAAQQTGANAVSVYCLTVDTLGRVTIAIQRVLNSTSPTPSQYPQALELNFLVV